jgi:hypothetical protein
VASNDTEAFRADEEGVDADVPVDAKNASTSDFENCRQFSTAPTPNLFFFNEERKNEERTTRNSVTEPSTKSDHLRYDVTLESTGLVRIWLASGIGTAVASRDFSVPLGV